MKKIILLLICAVLSSSLLACDMITEKWNELTGNNSELPLEDSQELLYEFNEEAQGYVVTGVSESAAHIVVPNTYGDYPVVAIGERAFSSCSSLTSVTIPDSVTTIGYSAFEYCSSLTSVTIGDSVTTIGDSAFYDCYSLKAVYITDVAAWCNISFDNYSANPLYCARNLYLNGELITELVIPDSVTTIGSYAFSRCSSLTSVTIGDSATTIGNSAFSNCDSLTSITIPDSVTTIADHAFYDCSSLTSVTIPNSVTTIGYCAFSECSSLKAVYITDVAAWCNISFGDYYANPLCYAENLYLHGELITELISPNGVTAISMYAFYRQSTITSVVIPNSVTTIGSSAFYNCTSLKAVYITDVAAWCNISFDNYYANPLYCARNLYLHGELITELVIPDSVTTIGSRAFYECSSLTSVTIPDSVTTIGYSAFSECSSLTSVTIPDSVTTIGYSAFSECSSLKAVYITDVAAWCNISFDNYSANPLYCARNLYLHGELITELVIPDSVTTIGNEAFYNCSSLTSVTIPDSVTTIGHWAFSGCSSLTSVTIGNGVTEIKSDAFHGCSMLKSIVIPNSVTSIGDYAFSDCSKLTSVIFEDPTGWWYASSANAISGTAISESILADASTAANYLESTYNWYYWFKD